MSQETLIKVEKVSKKFCRDLKKSLWYGVKDIAGEVMGRGNSKEELRPSEFWSVDDISFELKRSECLGLIGPNGAGKSTLLKMLNGLIKPDKGQISIRGRVGALIELGAGFNPILTGRENIYVNGAVLGFTKEEIKRKFAEIVEFAELDDFIDTPVQNYSSGMKVRLGFAVAAQMEPDVLLIDEVLAVGDIGFKVKCLNRISELLAKSSVIFVSHWMPLVSRICTHGLVMRRGKNVYFSPDVASVINTYYQEFPTGEYSASGSGEIELLSTTVNDQQNNQKIVIPFGGSFKICMKLAVKSSCSSLRCRIQIWNQDQRPVMDIVNDDFIPFEWDNDSSRVFLTASIPELRLSSGNYVLAIGIMDPKTMHALLAVQNVGAFTMAHHYTSGCDNFVAASWRKD